jgi:hypothetical protein
MGGKSPNKPPNSVRMLLHPNLKFFIFACDCRPFLGGFGKYNIAASLEKASGQSMSPAPCKVPILAR